MRDEAKVTPMTHEQIRAEFKKMDNKTDRLKPCGLSFDALLKQLEVK